MQKTAAEPVAADTDHKAYRAEVDKLNARHEKALARLQAKYGVDPS
ncbi:MAG TPA: hypothetical protein VEI45_23160 [Mycobacterium sp.]|nr:hypothetical protein [Mycobacterium sp.]HXY67188.1 hypothetical protein [Mycobacterium sp.]